MSTAVLLESGRSEREKATREKKHRGVYEKLTGSGIWWIRYADSDGKFRREKAGTKSAAINLYRKRKTQALEGEKLPTDLRRRAVSFGELADDAREYVTAKYSRPADDLARLASLKTYLTGRADAITPGQVEKTLDRLVTEKKWSASTRNHHHNLISLSYRLGILSGKVKENPARAVRRRAENNSRVRYLSADEEQKLRAAIRSNLAWAQHEPELTLALSTGLRRGSMYGDLIWENVDLVARTLTIPRTKNGESVTLPLNADAIAALHVFRGRGDATGRVVRNIFGKPIAWPKDWFTAALRTAGIQNFHWHDLRHTFASRLRQTGTPLGNIAELLGHKGLAMTRRYAHLSMSNLHDAVARIQNEPTPKPTPSPNVPVPKISYVN